MSLAKHQVRGEVFSLCHPQCRFGCVNRGENGQRSDLHVDLRFSISVYVRVFPVQT